MKNDFFTYSRRKIEKDKEEGRFDAAHNREMALRCFINFLGKEKLSLNEFTTDLMVDLVKDIYQRAIDRVSVSNMIYDFKNN